MAARDGTGAAALSPQAARSVKASAGAACLRRLASQATAPSGRRRRGGRGAEGARLESVYTGNRIGSSNPSPSAKLFANARLHRLLIAQVLPRLSTPDDRRCSSADAVARTR